MLRRMRIVDAWGDGALSGARAAARTDPADAALGDGSAEALLELGLLVRRRERAIAMVSGGALTRVGLHAQTDWMRGVVVVAGVAVGIVLAAMLGGVGGAVVGAAVMAGGLAAVLSVMEHHRSTRMQLRLARWMMRQCPACGYELHGLDEAEPARVAFVEIGPRACPECGLAWPLVPPAMSQERA